MNALQRHRALSRIWASDPGWRGWFTSVNHTDLGRMFMAVSAFFFIVASKRAGSALGATEVLGLWAMVALTVVLVTLGLAANAAMLF